MYSFECNHISMNSDLYSRSYSPSRPNRASAVNPYGRNKKIYHTIRDVDIEYSAKKRVHGELDEWDKFEDKVAKHLEEFETKPSQDDYESQTSKYDRNGSRSARTERHQRSRSPVSVSHYSKASTNRSKYSISTEDDEVKREAEYLEERLRKLQQRIQKKSSKSTKRKSHSADILEKETPHSLMKEQKDLVERGRVQDFVNNLDYPDKDFKEPSTRSRVDEWLQDNSIRPKNVLQNSKKRYVI